MSQPLTSNSVAVVFIEFQNEFTSNGGKLFPAVEASMKANATLENAQTVLKAAREKGILVIHVPIKFTENYRELSTKSYGILANVKNGQCFIESQWGSEFHEDFKPSDNEIVIEGKRGLCGFASTNLDFVLRQNGIKTIALAGYLTNCCVESTMRQGYELGYDVITLHDSCAATSAEEHDAAVKFTFPMFSTPMSTTSFLENIKEL